jgi:hypothetical protein
MHKVSDYKRKTKFGFGIYHFICCGVMHLFTLSGSRGILVLWINSSIFDNLLFIYFIDIIQWPKLKRQKIQTMIAKKNKN